MSELDPTTESGAKTLADQLVNQIKQASRNPEDFSLCELDDLVHDIKSGEASAINNQGTRGQLEYLLQAGCYDDVKERLKGWLSVTE